MGILKRRHLARLGGTSRLLAVLPLLVAAVAPVSEAVAKKAPVAAAMVVDMNTGAILYSQAPDVSRSPASLTKIMTLYVLFGYLRTGKMSLDTDLTVTPHAAGQAPTKLGLKPGSTIKVKDAMKALVTKSANDAAAVIAENIAGTEEDFGRLMTQTARSLGMKNTVFRNASGLPDDEQVSTARDMAILASHVIRDYPQYYDVFETRYFTYRGKRYRNHNRLLFGYKGTDGIKTGYTRASGFNLTASVKRDDKHLVAVVLGGKTGSQRDAACRKLLDQHFAKAYAGKPKVAIAPVKQPLPELQKPVVALASAASARASSSEEGDTGDQVRSGPTRVSLRGDRPRYAGDFHVQVGAFTNQTDAENRLGKVQQRAAKLLDGHLPFTASFMKDDTEWYRARFAGFSKADARSTCSALKKMSLECVVMTAD